MPEDYVSPPPVLFPAWCPECHVQDGNLTDHVTVVYCHRHLQSESGSLDHLVDGGYWYPGSDAGGKDARKLCDFIHRGQITTHG